MTDTGRMFGIGIRNIRKWSGNPRIIIIAVFIALNTLWCIYPIMELSADVGIGITPWLFPFISSDLYTQVTIILCAIFLFCDAPFLDESAPYVIVRSGRFSWAFGQVFYILLASALFVLFASIMSVIMILPRITLSCEWGKIIGSLCLTDAGAMYDVPFVFYQRILYSYSPATAMGLSLLLNWLMCCLIGFIMFALNLNVGKSAGTGVCCGVVMLNYFISNFLNNEGLRYSPISLSNLAYLNTHDMTPSYAICVLAGCSVIFIILTMVTVRKKDLSAICSI